MKKIITITTDFGVDDYFTGVMKGVMLSVNPDAVLVDLNNCVKKFDVFAAAVSLRNSFNYFPEGAVHLVVVDPGVGGTRSPIIVNAGGYYFVGPDNGVFSFIYSIFSGYRVYEISNSEYMLPEISSTFHGRDIFAPAAAYLTKGIRPEHFGGMVKDPVTLSIPDPVIQEKIISGTVIYTDSFGNLITNVPAEMVGSNDIIKAGGMTLDQPRESYSEACAGEPVAVIGSSGYLELAVNMGSAAEYFEKHVSDTNLTVDVIKVNL